LSRHGLKAVHSDDIINMRLAQVPTLAAAHFSNSFDLVFVRVATESETCHIYKSIDYIVRFITELETCYIYKAFRLII
jgi:hypothetical protein